MSAAIQRRRSSFMRLLIAPTLMAACAPLATSKLKPTPLTPSATRFCVAEYLGFIYSID